MRQCANNSCGCERQFGGLAKLHMKLLHIGKSGVESLAADGRKSNPLNAGLPQGISLQTGRWPAIYTTSVSRRRLPERDRKSTRLNSSHVRISYAVFCLKKKKQQ